MSARLAIWRVLRTPIWAAQLATSAKSFEKNGLLGSERLNRAGLHRRRVELAAASAARRRARLAGGVPREWLEQFARDGFILVPDAMPPDSFARLRDQALEWQAMRRDMVQGNAVTRRMAVDKAMLSANAELRAFLTDPQIRAAMRYVAGFDSEPLHYLQAILRRAGTTPDPQTALHADTFHSSMKSWLFLTDVAPGGGAFTYVPGSHRMTPERLAWEERMALSACNGELDRLSGRGSFRIDDRALAEIGLPPPRELAVPANTLVIADTVGFHARGASPPDLCRVEVWSYLRRNPFLPWTGLDPLSHSAIAAHRVNWLWSARDRFSKQLGQPWKPVGRGRITD